MPPKPEGSLRSGVFRELTFIDGSNRSFFVAVIYPRASAFICGALRILLLGASTHVAVTGRCCRILRFAQDGVCVICGFRRCRLIRGSPTELLPTRLLETSRLKGE
jgi:hypothetical protein